MKFCVEEQTIGAHLVARFQCFHFDWRNVSLMRDAKTKNRPLSEIRQIVTENTWQSCSLMLALFGFLRVVMGTLKTHRMAECKHLQSLIGKTFKHFIASLKSDTSPCKNVLPCQKTIFFIFFPVNSFVIYVVAIATALPQKTPVVLYRKKEWCQHSGWLEKIQAWLLKLSKRSIGDVVNVRVLVVAVNAFPV